MIEIAKAHGFSYIRECSCANPGSIYAKGRNKLTIYRTQPKFLLKRIGGSITTGKTEDLETVLNKFGL